MTRPPPAGKARVRGPQAALARHRPPREATAERLRQAAGPLTAEAVARMHERFAWYREMGADERSWIGLVAQSGITVFLDWLRSPGGRVDVAGLAAGVFGSAPRELARAVSLQQTVDLVRVAVAVVEEHAPELAEPEGRPALREAVLVFSRDVAFAAAEVYARAAEERGAWDARLEALIVDHVLREEPTGAVLSRAAALGWGAPAAVTVIAGLPPVGSVEQVLEGVHRAAAHAALQVLAGVQGDRLAVITGLGQAADSAAAMAAEGLLAAFGPGPVVYVTPVGALEFAGAGAAAALAAVRAAPAWPQAPRPVHAEDLLPERAVAGDIRARVQLMENVYNLLAESAGDLLATVAAYVEHGGSWEAAGRALFVHPNTVRYRLKRASELTGLPLATPRGRFAAQVALVLGRLEPLSPPSL